MSKLLTPRDVVAKLSRQYKEKWRSWALAEVGHPARDSEVTDWPNRLHLGRPARIQLDDELESVGKWADTWKMDQVPDGIEVEWVERSSRYGSQRLPFRAIVHSPRDMARLLNEQEAWERAVTHARLLVELVPAVEPRPALLELSLLSDIDVQLAGLAAKAIRCNPSSGLYPRQLAIPGLDTKWVEGHQGVLRSLTSDVTNSDFGLRRVPTTADLLLADPSARDNRRLPRFFSVSRDELADFDHGLPPSEMTVLIVENRQCAIDLPDFHGLVVLHGLGNSAPELVAATPWIRNAARILYWGDMDLAGYSILHRLRTLGIAAESLLMCTTTFESMLQQATVGRDQTPGTTDLLGEAEAGVVAGILESRWGDVRQIEQEKIPTQVAVAALIEAGLQPVTAVMTAPSA